MTLRSDLEQRRGQLVAELADIDIALRSLGCPPPVTPDQRTARIEAYARDLIAQAATLIDRSWLRQEAATRPRLAPVHSIRRKETA